MASSSRRPGRIPREIFQAVDRHPLLDQLVGVPRPAVGDHPHGAPGDPVEGVVGADVAGIGDALGVDDDDVPGPDLVVERAPGVGAVPVRHRLVDLLRGAGGHPAPGGDEAHGVGEAVDAVPEGVRVPPQGADLPVQEPHVLQGAAVHPVADVGDAEAPVALDQGLPLCVGEALGTLAPMLSLTSSRQIGAGEPSTPIHWLDGAVVRRRWQDLLACPQQLSYGHACQDVPAWGRTLLGVRRGW